MSIQENIGPNGRRATVFCDTDCELWYERANEFDIKVIRMPYSIDGEERLADLGETFDPDEFYTRMRSGASVSTAGLNDATYYEIFQPYFERGDDILYIAFSSKMSATFTYLDVAINRLRTEYPGVKFLKFDTLSICQGSGILVYLGAKYLREHGNDIEATYNYLETIVNKSRIYFVVEDMQYLARGGRITAAKAKIGTIMNIKPVLTVIDGKLDVIKKAQGIKNAYKFMLEEFDAQYDSGDSPVIILDAQNKQVGDELLQKALELHPEAKPYIWRHSIGPVVGVHAGPGTIGIIYMGK